MIRSETSSRYGRRPDTFQIPNDLVDGGNKGPNRTPPDNLAAPNTKGPGGVAPDNLESSGSKGPSLREPDNLVVPSGSFKGPRGVVPGNLVSSNSKGLTQVGPDNVRASNRYSPRITRPGNFRDYSRYGQQDNSRMPFRGRADDLRQGNFNNGAKGPGQLRDGAPDRDTRQRNFNGGKGPGQIRDGATDLDTKGPGSRPSVGNLRSPENQSFGKGPGNYRSAVVSDNKRRVAYRRMNNSPGLLRRD